MAIGVLTSGNLGKDTLIKMVSKFDIGFVLTDSNSLEIIEVCNNHKIPVFKGNPRNGKAYEFIKNIEVDIIASINYLFLINKDIIQHSKKLTFNIHGSLLPKYRGRTPHVWAIINNEKETGITAHIIDEGCDTGDVISQITVPITKTDTGVLILDKYKKQYFNLVNNVIESSNNNSIIFTKQNELQATYYEKRTPEDGNINWNWQRERIENWVRAQANPYPGAFSMLAGKKIIIDKVIKSSLGYSDEMENGLILNIEPKIIVKTPNGALELKELRKPIELKIGDKLL